jgi:hypothetical protein
MKKLLLLSLALGIVFCSCNNTKKTKEETQSNKSVATESISKGKDQAKSITELYGDAENKVGKVVSCKGKVKHVCSHSGKRCFLIDKEGNSIRVESGGKINGFNKELLGSNIMVKGTLKMIKLDNKKIEEMEKQEDHCDTESTNIKKMRAWMKKNKKDYYAIYYIQCLDYETLE